MWATVMELEKELSEIEKKKVFFWDEELRKMRLKRMLEYARKNAPNLVSRIESLIRES